MQTKYFYIGDHKALFVREDGSKLILDLRDRGILNFLAHNKYEPDVTAAIKRFLSPGDTYIDVGANVGIHVIAAFRHMQRTGRVVAIEPNPRLFPLLKEAVVQNSALGVVDTVEAAAWNSIGSLTFSADPEHHRVGAVSLEGAINFGADTLNVKAVRIDDLDFDKKSVRLIKIDVEGREPFVIEGAMETIESSRCAVICEYHEDVVESVYGAARFSSLIDHLGLTPHTIDAEGTTTAIDVLPKTHVNLVLMPH